MYISKYGKEMHVDVQKMLLKLNINFITIMFIK